MLSDEDVLSYRNRGYITMGPLFAEGELEVLRCEAERELNADDLRRTLEAGSRVPRAVHGSHLFNATFERLVRLPRLLDVAVQVTETPVYVHQFKINAKTAFSGDLWEWHQDFYFWKREDAMPRPRALSMAIFLDEVNEFNGPLLVIPGSHRVGELPVTERYADGEAGWTETVSARLKYELRHDALRDLVRRRGMDAPKGPAGTVLMFDSQIVHGSTGNISPFDRRLIIVSYNSVNNRLRNVVRPRPEFLASRRFEALTPIEDCVPALA